MPTVIKFTPPNNAHETLTRFSASVSEASNPSSRCHIKLKIERGGLSENKYIYKYSVSEMVMSKEIEFIDFELFDTSQLKVHEVFIHGYVSSRPDAFQPVKTAVGGGLATDISLESSKLPFEEYSTYVRFKPELNDLELVHIGLIIAIKETPNSDIEYILCDPQVGNGPPPSSGGTKSNSPFDNKMQFDIRSMGLNEYFGFNLN